MVAQNVATHRFRRSQNCLVCYRSAKRRAQCRDGGDVAWPLRRNRARDDSAQAVADEVDLTLRLQQRLVDAGVEPPLDEKVRTLRVDADARVVRAVSDPLQPRMKLPEVRIGAEKSGD